MLVLVLVDTILDDRLVREWIDPAGVSLTHGGIDD
jgi:hypothetical protein